ncbi:portal protein [Variovorax sp. JS1663]|uniref:portal protein n=1 Tax=Variovorax sp. JS1663 TaxID=1851577 RepID=UPI000B343BEC|nr:hypothetical protein [Variovorax sp. JS1663]OUM01661.1 hypothetical protein A8M77_15420 [Variovorax sp. JS1663]
MAMLAMERLMGESAGAEVRAPEAEPNDYSDHLSKLVGYFEEAEDTGREARLRSERCRDYYNNNQLSAQEIAILKKRGQPPIYVNYIQRKVDTICGIERRSRTDPKAFPRNPDDEDTSNAATDALRYVADQNKFNAVRSEVYNDILVEGYGGADVVVEEMPNGDQMIKVKRVPWDRLVIDPHSRQLDFSDANYKGIVIWMDAEEARRKWPNYADSINDTLSSTSASETFDDRPKYGTWCDNRRTRVRVVQMHYREGDDWFLCTYTKCGYLEPPEKSPYLDKFGRPTSSLKIRSAYVNRENERYGHVEGLIPLQDEINKRRSKSLHLLSQRQTFGKKLALADTAKAKVELAKPDGHVELQDGAKFGEDFGVIPTGDMANGQIELMQQALAEMNATGANAAMQGKDERSQSGVALQTRIQAGAVELEPLADGLREWTQEVFEAMWMRVRQFWTAEKWIRVTDDDRNVRFVGLNKQVTLGDKLAQLAPQEQQAMVQQLGLSGPYDPRLREVVDVENDVSGLDVDIVIEEGPDLASLQSEQFEILAGLAKNGVPIPPKALIQASAIKPDTKRSILEEMEKGPQIPPDMQKQLEELQQRAQQLEQENQQLKGDRELEARKLDIEEMKVLGTQQPPAQPQGQEPMTPKDLADVELKHAQAEKARADAEKVRIETITQANQLGEQGISTETDEATGAPKPSALDTIAAAMAAQAQALAELAQAQMRPRTATLSNGKTITVQ